jgi:hypothetical protein
MSYPRDPRFADAKSKSVMDVLSLLKVSDLRQTPNKRELSGPCPQCGTAGHNPKSGPSDRFNINLASGAYFCRQCKLRGGDVIELVREVRGCSFPEALTILCGEKPVDETEEQKAARIKRTRKLEEQLEREAEDREREAERYRRYVIEEARMIWANSRPGHRGVVGAYLAARGISREMLPDIPDCLNFIVKHPYEKKIKGQKVTAHVGPCMIARIVNPAGDLVAVHQTWVSEVPPHGKATITHDGEKLNAKLVRGSKKGNAIRLCTPDGADTLIMGEGIETTLTAMVAQPVPGAAYWAGVDLGNMAGKMEKVPGTMHSGVPDMTDARAFVPPPWVKRLIFIQDGDSDPKATRAKLESGLRRAMAVVPGLTGQIVHAGDGVDLNDVLNEKDT